LCFTMETTNLIIRPERISDYPEIALLNVRAFGNRTAEAIIVALHRQRRAFDPELSLVAETNGRIIGHVLFSPHQMRLLNQTIPAVNLAPIAVDPAYQGQGIGGKLITEGHRIAAAKGHRMSVLLGHPTYYPRFGYHTHTYGVAQLMLSGNVLDVLHEELLETRSPSNEDVPLLYDLWQREERAVDMVFVPDRDLLDWLSPNPAIRAEVYLRNNEVVGYTRIHSAEPTKPRAFLTKNHEAARAMVVTMNHVWRNDAAGTEYILPLHPYSASVQVFGSAGATCESLVAGMACALGSSPLDDYLGQVRAGQRMQGRPIWPVVFDLE
jgi:putative acetyltransferase